MTHPRISRLCFDRLLDRNSTAIISLSELRQLYQQSRTEKEKDQCFDPYILDRLRTNDFNEVVNMYMDPENDKFDTNYKILHSLKGPIVLKGENGTFSDYFDKHFLNLIDRIEGNLLLVFVDVRAFGRRDAEQCAQVLSKKLERGQKVFCIDFFTLIPGYAYTINQMHSHQCMKDSFTIYYKFTPCILYGLSTGYTHDLKIQNKNGLVNTTKTFISMINGDRFARAKQHLVRVLKIVKATELSGGGERIMCENCFARHYSYSAEIHLYMEEPTWSNCAGCRLKL